jgi:exodeoxyribonuclease VII large subunit
VPDQDTLRQQLDGISAAMDNQLTRQIKNARRQLAILAQSPSLTSPDQYILQRRKTLELLKGRVFTAQSRVIHAHKQRFIAATAKLDAMSPLKVLTRGYAMAQDEENNVIRSVKQTKIGDMLNISLSDGTVSATVTQVKENAL